MKVCFISHSAALTGAERSLLTAIEFLVRQQLEIMAVLPRHGPLEAALIRLRVDVHIAEISRWDRDDPSLAYRLVQDAQVLASLAKRHSCHVIYTNTSVIATGALAAGLAGLPHIWHVREFVRGDGVLTGRERVEFIRQTSNGVLFNSCAVRDDTTGPAPWPQAQVVYNFVELMPYRAAYPAAAAPMRVDILLRAASADAVIACAGALAVETGEALRTIHLDIPARERRRALLALASAGIGQRRGSSAEAGDAAATPERSADADLVILHASATLPRGWLAALHKAAAADDRADLLSPLNIDVLDRLADRIAAPDAETLTTLTAYADAICEARNWPAVDIDGSCVYVKRKPATAEALAEGLGTGYDHQGAAARLLRKFTEQRLNYAIAPRVLMQNPATDDARRHRTRLARAQDGERTTDLGVLLNLCHRHPNLVMAPKLLVLANVVRMKGQDQAIKALAELDDLTPAPHLILAGSRHSEPAFVQELTALAAALGVSNRVHMVGEVYDPRALVGFCDCMIAPCQWEAWGRTAVEGMLLNCPVIAAAAGGLVEIIEHERTGLLYPPGDAEALAQAIRRLLSDATLRARLVGAAKRAAAERYGLDAYGGAIQTALERASRESNPAGTLIQFASLVGDGCEHAVPILSVLKHRASPYPLLGAIKRRLRRARTRLGGGNQR